MSHGGHCDGHEWQNGELDLGLREVGDDDQESDAHILNARLDGDRLDLFEGQAQDEGEKASDEIADPWNERTFHPAQSNQFVQFYRLQTTTTTKKRTMICCFVVYQLANVASE